MGATLRLTACSSLLAECVCAAAAVTNLFYKSLISAQRALQCLGSGYFAVLVSYKTLASQKFHKRIGEL